MLVDNYKLTSEQEEFCKRLAVGQTIEVAWKNTEMKKYYSFEEAIIFSKKPHIKRAIRRLSQTRDQ